MPKTTSRKIKKLKAKKDPIKIVTVIHNPISQLIVSIIDKLVDYQNNC